MSSVTIYLRIVKSKRGHGISLPCPYCSKHSKSFEGLRKHLTRNHDAEFGIAEVKKQAVKLYKMYRGTLK